LCEKEEIVVKNVDKDQNGMINLYHFNLIMSMEIQIIIFLKIFDCYAQTVILKRRHLAKVMVDLANEMIIDKIGEKR